MTALTGTDPREVLAERLIEDVTRSLETLSVCLGVRLGLYRALHDRGGATESDVAGVTGVTPRYAREWLEQQTTAGYVACDDLAAPAAARRYRLPAGHAEVLLDADSPYHAVPGVVMFGGLSGLFERVVDAYRTGHGIPYAEYGEAFRRGIAAFNRPMFMHELAGWLAAAPDLDERMRAAPPARVLDLGCGLGASSVATALAYPRVSVVGVDLDAASVAEAYATASEAGVADRVTFVAGDAARVSGDGPYDLVTIFEALHDMADPVGVLRSARAVLADGGSVLVADERVGDELAAPGTLLERFQFGWSLLHCLPATLAEDGVEANGAMLRAPTVARWARQAGFADLEVPPIENDFWRFYRMRGSADAVT